MRSSTLSKPASDSRLGEDLLWREVRTTPFSKPAKALFLDRDGVLIEEKEYIQDPADVVLLPGVVELIRAARELGMATVEVTNQAGIAHGYSGWAEFIEVENRVGELLRQSEVSLDGIFACPFHPRGKAPYNSADHAWRKPNPGMLLEAAKSLNLDLRDSVMVGDKPSDLEAARTAKFAFGIHVLTGHGKRDRELSRAVATPDFPVHVVSSAADAVTLLRARWNHP